MWWTDGRTDKDLLTAPMVELNENDANTVQQIMNSVKKNGSIIVTISSGDHNVWAPLFRSTWFILFRVYMCALSAVGVYLASTRLFRWRSAHLRGVHVSRIAVVCLLIEGVSNLTRLVYFAIDPLFSGQIIPYLPSRILLTITGPLGFITTVLIALFWAQILKSRTFAGSFLTKMKWPFCILSLFLLALDVVVAIFNAELYFPETTVVQLAGGVFFISQLVIAVLFLVLAIRLLKRLSPGGRVNSEGYQRRSKYLRKFTWRILVSGVSNTIILLLLCVPTPLTSLVSCNKIGGHDGATGRLLVYNNSILWNTRRLCYHVYGGIHWDFYYQFFPDRCFCCPKWKEGKKERNTSEY